MRAPDANEILRAVRTALAGRERFVLAVSGGVDSMVLLDAVARARASGNAVVATFDHGTGVAARRAVRLVQAEGERRGFAVRVGHAKLAGASEAQWRAARWRFLREIAASECAQVCTGHTRDDQVETVVIRLLRGTGVRGLAGLLAPSDVVRPLLQISRTSIGDYANRNHVRFIEDPSNASPRYLRNRVRHELLPAIRTLQPEFEGAMLRLADRAAVVRRELDQLACRVMPVAPRRGFARVDVGALEGLSDPELRLLWQSIAQLAGVRLDWRGTARAARFARTGRRGQSIQLSGGVEVIRDAATYVMRAGDASAAASAPVPLSSHLRFGDWHFHRLDPDAAGEVAPSPWVAAVPLERDLTVRSWQPGDRIVLNAGTPGSRGHRERRVARFFADAGIAGPLRRGWPVVLSAGKVIWIPGVRSAQVEVSLTPAGTVLYACEHRPG